MGLEREGIRGSRWEAEFRATGLWSTAPADLLETLVDQTSVQTCRRGEVLFVEGTIADRVLLILHGQVRGVHYETTGHVVILEVLDPGSIVGTISAFGDAPFEGDVEAGADTVVAWIPIAALEGLIRSWPEAAMRLVRVMARRWVSVVSAGKRNAATVPARLARYLAEQPRTDAGSGAYRVRIPMKRVELAATLATSPETLSRAFRRLRADGLIEDSGRSVTVLDGVGLQVVAQGETG